MTVLNQNGREKLPIKHGVRMELFHNIEKMTGQMHLKTNHDLKYHIMKAILLGILD